MTTEEIKAIVAIQAVKTQLIRLQDPTKRQINLYSLLVDAQEALSGHWEVSEIGASGQTEWMLKAPGRNSSFHATRAEAIAAGVEEGYFSARP